MAVAVLTLNRALLESATQVLLATEVLEGDALRAMLAQVQTPTKWHDWLAKG
ncbi:MAG: hypothetical protein KME45_15950 [Stenomitos rutilans HA7619-LM2]|jgi:cell division protease FtsH|nr:hypothetical protein [Stenomitos rutilans HA7619-LM2]